MESQPAQRRTVLPLWAILLVVLVAITLYRSWVGSGPPPSRLVQLTGPTMGTQYSVKVRASLSAPDEETLHASLRRELDTIIQQMSTYEPTSEVSRFNQSRSTEPFEVSEATAKLVAESLEISRLSQGAFDITVGPMVDAWGFGPPGPPTSAPSDEDLEALEARVGFDKVQAQLDPPRLTKLHPEVQLDLSAIAKGYGVDRLAEIIEARGIQDYLVDIGGEVRAKGTSPEGRPWRLGIEEPTRGSRKVRAVVELSDGALATSGNYRNAYELDGVLVAHTLDPATGRPVRHRLLSVTIHHSRCALADAWATALMVIGPERALEVARQHNLESYVVIASEGGTFTDDATPGFLERLAEPMEQP